jgi:TATA-box binding protein (TBP) (component of TFIID and TFIIIB)
MSKLVTQKNIPTIAMQKVKSFVSLVDLPDELNISTITITCGFNTTFNIENIGKYMKLIPNKIVYIKAGKEPNSIRSLINIKSKAKKKKKQKKAFYNQATLKIISSFKSSKKPVNVKLFKNGSIQMTGCVSLDNIVDTLTILCDELVKVRAILEPLKMKSMVIKSYVGDASEINITKVNDVKIRMINSNFRIGFKVDREQLYQILLGDGIECTYEPCVHACINIKYYTNSDKVSIFVFESGAIIITGGKSKDNVVGAYNFITKKLFDNYKNIIKTNIDDVLHDDEGVLQELMAELEID